mmetsp:Transcript_36519/g.93028  ORF Transcript_36519/g.93028 Transcript_36519/m.93028 type:complete len:200 (+) Transcript_36519:1717-2316(+)
MSSVTQRFFKSLSTKATGSALGSSSLASQSSASPSSMASPFSEEAFDATSTSTSTPPPAAATATAPPCEGPSAAAASARPRVASLQRPRASRLRMEPARPHSETMPIAFRVAPRKSALAPELTSSGRSSASSATRPPRSTQSMAIVPWRVRMPCGREPAAPSSTGSNTVTPPMPPERGRMEARATRRCVSLSRARPTTT